MIKVFNIKNIFLSFFLFFISTYVFANQYMTIQGRILNSDGSALTASSVQFKAQIRTSGSEDCLLYEEVQTLDLSQTQGDFVLTIGQGTRSSSSVDGGNALNMIFSNSKSISLSAAPSACANAATSYTPSAADNRHLVLSYNDGTGWDAIPTIPLSWVPQAMYAEDSGQLNGVNGTQYLKVVTGVTPTTLSGVDYTNLTTLLSGTNTNYVQTATIPVCSAGQFISAAAGGALSCQSVSGAAGGTVTSVTSTNSYLSVATGTSTPALTLNVGTVANTVAAGNDSRITGALQSGATAGGDLTGTYPNPTLNTSAVTTAKINDLAVTAAKIANSTITDTQISASASISDSKLATISTAGKVSGSAITSGAISGSTAISTSGNLVTSGTVQGGTLSSTHATTRDLQLYDSGSNKVTIQSPTSLSANYNLTLPTGYPASSGYVLSSDTSGVLSWIAPSSGSVTSVSGTSPITISGTTSAPIVNVNNASTAASGVVTLASDGGTTASTVVQATDSRLSNSRAPSGGAGGDLSGNYPNPSVVKLQGTAVSSTPPTMAGQSLRFNGTNWTPNFISMADLRSTVTGSSALTSCSANQTLTWSAATDNLACSNISISASNFSSQTANTFLAAPNGSSGTPTFRTIASADLPSGVVSTGTYKSVTVDTYGRVIAGSNPTTVSGYGITDALQNLGGTPGLQTGLDASKPSSPAAGTIYFATDTNKVWQYNSSAWSLIASASGSGGTITALTGDVAASGTGSVAATVNAVGASSAANIHTAELLANAATNANTVNTIVKRDASGNFSAGTITANLTGNVTGNVTGAASLNVLKSGDSMAGNLTFASTKGSVFTDSGSNTVSLQAPTTVSTSYVLKLPTSVAASSGQVLTSDTSGNLSWTTPSSVATSYSGVLPVANGGTNSSVTLNNNRVMVSSGGSIVEAGAMMNGQLLIGSTGAAPVVASLTAGSGISITPGAGSISFSTSGLGTTSLADGKIWVGQSGTPTAITPSSDVSMTNAGAFTVTKLQGTSVSSTTPTMAGQSLRFNGTNWTPNFISMADLRSTVTGSSALTSCSANQTLTWSAATDNLACSNISISASNFSSQTANTFLAAPNGSSGTPTFRTIASADLPLPASNSLGGVQSAAAISHQWINSISTSGIPALSQPAFSDISGAASLTTQVSGILPVANGGTGSSSLAATFALNGGQAGAITVGTSDATNLTLNTNGSARMTILSSGNIGIGGTTPQFNLHVMGSSSSAFVTSEGSGSGSTGWFLGRQSRGTTSAPTATQAGDSIAGYLARGYGTTAYASASTGYMTYRAAENFSDTAMGTYFALGTTPIGSVTSVERLRILDSGNVGIGTTAPNQLFAVGSSNNFTVSSAGAISGLSLALPSLSSLTLSSGVTNLSVILSAGSTGSSLIYNPAAKIMWHDRFAFSKAFGAPTFETYNGTWNTASLDTGLFAQMENRSVQQIDGVTNTAARWTWNNSGVAFSTIEWMAIGFTYSATASSKNILIETSTDGTTWTTRHTSTGNTANAVPVLFALSTPMNGDTYIRLTITITNGQPLMLSSMRGLSARWGNQGGGSEQETPFSWDASQRVAFGSSTAVANSIVTIGSNTTAATGGLYFGTDTNLYRIGNTALRTDGSFYAGGNLGVGNSAPNYKLDVTGDINTSSCFRIGATTVSGTCTSDARLKEDIHDYKAGLKDLLSLRLHTYKFNGLGEMPKTGEVAVGVIAQEVEKTNPELVKTRLVKMHLGDVEKTEIKVVDYSKFSYMLINAVKELYQKWFDDHDELLDAKQDIKTLKAENLRKSEIIQKLEQKNAAITSYLCAKDPMASICH